MYERTTGRTVFIEGKEYLYFAGTSYLGLHVHPEWQSLIAEGNARYGSHYGGSRLFRHVPDIYERLEKYFALHFGFEAALLCSSGSLAGQLIVRNVPEDAALCYLEVHPSARLSLERRSRDFNTGEALVAALPSIPEREIWIFTNSVYPSRGTRRQWDWLEALDPTRRYVLLIDDAHGLGMIGPNGNGTVEELPELPAHVRVMMNFSLGKAYSTPGAIILGDVKWIERIRRHPLWGGASPPPPGPLYAFLEGSSILREAKAHLTALVQQAEQLTIGLPGLHLKGFPVFVYQKPGLDTILYNSGVILSAFHYPTPQSARVSRLVLNACHRRDDLEQVFALLKEIDKGI